MNKHDIEELQSFLQGEYIEESTSRSLKEVKQHQKDVSSNKDAGDITRVRKVLKSKLENDNTNNTYGRYDGKRDVYDKTPAIRDKIRIHLFMKKSECKNSDELYAFNYADKVLSGSNKTEVKNKMCRLVGFDPKVYGMDLYKHQPGEYFSVNFIENATKSRQLSPTEINKYRYFHFSKTGNLHNVGLSSSRSTIHGGGSIIYPSKCIFFYAVEKTADLDNVLARMINGDPREVRSAFFYGDYVYEYIPKKSDKIYIDSTDDSNLLQLQQKTRNHGFFKVFLNLAGEGRSSVSVKEFNFNISYNKQNIMNQEETKLRSYTARLEDIYDWNPKQADKVVDIFSKYIHDHETNPNSPKPRKELDASLKSLADFYRSAVDKFIDEEKIPQAERRLFKKNAYGHFHKILKTKLNKRFEYGSNDYKMLTKYFHEYSIDENVDDDYITEATSRSLKEVKQHQKDVNKNAVKADMTYIQNFARKCVESTDSTNHRNKRHINLSKHECKNEKDLFAFNYLMELYKKIENKKYFDQFFKLFGFDGSRVEIRGRYHSSWGLGLSLYVVTNGETFLPRPGVFFIHTTTVPTMTALDGYTNNGGTREYAGNCIFFFAIKANDIREAIKKLSESGHKYGKYAYQYIPKKSDRFFVDSYHNNDTNTFGKHNDITAVFIQVKEDQKLPVKNVSNFFMDDNANKAAKKRYLADIKRLEDLKKNRIANIKKYADKYTRKINELETFLKDEPYNEDYYMPQINELKQKLEELDKSYDDKIKKVEDSIMLAEKKYGFTRTMVESYIDENVDDDYITEANEESKKARKNAQEFMRKEYGTAHPTSMTSKQRNRMKKWLKDNDYDSKTGTITTDIIDKKTGKPVRVNVGTNAYALDPDILGHPAQAFAIPNTEESGKYLSDTLLRDGRGYINMPLSEMKRHPSVSNGISKHEEGHIADMQYGEKMLGKRNGRRKLKKINIKDYGPHINQDELAADVYSVQHNKYKDKLGFIKRLSSSDIRARKGLRHDLYKVYKLFYDENLKDVDMTDVNKLKTILKDMIKDSETELKDLKQFEKLNDNDAFRANVTGVENGIKSYKRLLGKIENITPDEFKGEFKRAVFNSYKPYFVEVLKVFDRESEFRADFAKRYIKEFATEYDMSTLEVIQEMYLQDMAEYVFQEESESIESYIDENVDDDYITEATSRSLKEVKQYQKQQLKDVKKYNIDGIKKYIQKHFLQKTDDDKYVLEWPGNKVGNEQTFENMSIDYLNTVVNGYDVDDYGSKKMIHIKNKLCDLCGLNKNNYGIRIIYKYTVEFMPYKSSVHDLIPLNNINGYLFLHLDKLENLTKLEPRHQSVHGNIGYARKSVFFWAVKKSELARDKFLSMMEEWKSVYGKNIYQYIPKSTDKFYIDKTDYDSSKLKRFRLNGTFPVFIETENGIHVKKFDLSNFIKRKDLENKTVYDSIKHDICLSDIRSIVQRCKEDIGSIIFDYGYDQFEKKNPNKSNESFDFDNWNPMEDNNYGNDGSNSSIKFNKKSIKFKHDIQSIIFKTNNKFDSYIKTLSIDSNEKNELRNYYKKCMSSMAQTLKSEFGSYNVPKSLKSYVGSLVNNRQFTESYIDETIERFDAFMEEFNNGQIGNSEFIMESVQDNEYAKIVKDYIKKSGRRYFRYKRGEDHLPKEVEDKIFDLAKKIVEFPPNGDYSQYKMYYKSFCKIVNYPLDTVIMGMMINDEHNGYINMGALGGYRGAKRCVLKPGTHLFHSSDNPNLTMINPNHFKGKPNIIEIGDKEIPTGDYDSYYACPRIYFHVEKMGSRQASAYGTVKYDSNNMPIIENKPTSGHMYMYIVKPTDRIFFDPELNAMGDKDGAVYMLIDKPVKLTKIY